MIPFSEAEIDNYVNIIMSSYDNQGEQQDERLYDIVEVIDIIKYNINPYTSILLNLSICYDGLIYINDTLLSLVDYRKKDKSKVKKFIFDLTTNNIPYTVLTNEAYRRLLQNLHKKILPNFPPYDKQYATSVHILVGLDNMITAICMLSSKSEYFRRCLPEYYYIHVIYLTYSIRYIRLQTEKSKITLLELICNKELMEREIKTLDKKLYNMKLQQIDKKAELNKMHMSLNDTYIFSSFNTQRQIQEYLNGIRKSLLDILCDVILLSDTIEKNRNEKSKLSNDVKTIEQQIEIITKELSSRADQIEELIERSKLVINRYR